MNISNPNLHTFTLPPHLGGNSVDVKLHLGSIIEIVFYDNEYNPLIIVSKNFHLINRATIVYIKVKVYETN